MSYCLYALALIGIFLGLALLLRFSFCSPLVINSLVWLVVFLCGLLFHNRFSTLKDESFFAWYIWFMVTNLMFFLVCSAQRKGVSTDEEIRKVPLDYTLLLLVLIAWLVYRIWIIGSTGPAHFWLNLRLSSINAEGVASLGLVGRFYPLVFALFLFEHVYAYQGNRHLRFLLWCWMLLYAVATMGKFSLLTPIVSWVIIRGIQGKLDVKKVLVLVPVVFGFMMVLHFLRAAASDNSSITDILAIYVYSPLVALGYMNIDGSSLPIGAYVLRFLYAVGYRLGILETPPVNTILEYVQIPLLTNVYTVMQPFYHDFGLIGVLWGAVLYGLFYSCLYAFSLKGNGLALILFAGYSIVLVGQFLTVLLIP